jgi:hypothetical protein
MRHLTRILSMFYIIKIDISNALTAEIHRFFVLPKERVILPIQFYDFEYPS